MFLDITRLRKEKSWKATSANPAPHEFFPFVDWPRLWEDPNDDIVEFDESTKVNPSGRMYVFDIPGFEMPRPDPEIERAWGKINFVEFMRVRFDHTEPSGGSPGTDDTSGSMTSLPYKWHSALAIIFETFPAFDWRRTTAEEGGTNSLDGNQWITIGDMP